MMQCFSPWAMHWASGLFLELPLGFICLLFLGGICGFLWQSPKKDSIYSALVLLLFCLVTLSDMMNTIYQTNPPYCWGDSWGEDESFVTRSPVMWEIFAWNLMTIVPVFLASMTLMAWVKWNWRRLKSSNQVEQK